MKGLQPFIAGAGYWRGEYVLCGDNVGHKKLSSVAIVTPMIDNKFIRLDYEWDILGLAKEGSLMFSCDEKSGKSTAYWMDSYHLGEKVMKCKGYAPNVGSISVMGSYGVAGQPDWYWRILVWIVERDLHLKMVNISPEQIEREAIVAKYSK
jgi:hypothetical protein